MKDTATMAKICEGWCVVCASLLRRCKDDAARGVFNTTSLNDLRDAVDQLGAAFDWLPLDVDHE